MDETRAESQDVSRYNEHAHVPTVDRLSIKIPNMKVLLNQHFSVFSAVSIDCRTERSVLLSDCLSVCSVTAI